VIFTTGVPVIVRRVDVVVSNIFPLVGLRQVIFPVPNAIVLADDPLLPKIPVVSVFEFMFKVPAVKVIVVVEIPVKAS
jgi:hypothetical protein